MAAGTDGRGIVEDLRGTGALVFRPAGSEVWMVAAAASPIGGDRQLIRVVVGEGSRLVVRSVSATVARRGTDGLPSETLSAVRIGGGATLVWEPEPGVAAHGCNHMTDTRIHLAASASLWWREDWILGRHGEGPGRWRSRIRLSVTGNPTLVSDLATGPGAPGWASRAGLAGARAISTVVIAGPAFGPSGRQALTRPDGPAPGAMLPLPVSGWQVTSWGEDLRLCRQTVEELLECSASRKPALAAGCS